MAPRVSPQPPPPPPRLGPRAARPPARSLPSPASGGGWGGGGETPALPGREGATPRVAIATATSRAFALVGCLVIAALIGLPLIASRSLMQDLVFIFYMFTLAQFWNLLAGYVSLVSVGQTTIVRLGCYLLFSLTVIVSLD